MTDNQKIVVSHVLMQIVPGTVVNEDTILKYVKAFEAMNPLTSEEEKAVISELHVKLGVHMDRGACIKQKDHISWYYTAKKQFPSSFWDRYRLYLIRNLGLNADVIHTIDTETDELMDLLGNLTLPNNFSVKGLVIGDVQSGKTATYTALINKAADAGYGVIILLTGTIEKLRRQTQQRLDEGFTGLDSTALIRNKGTVTTGVGCIDSSVYGWSFTSTTNDFNSNAANQLNGRLKGVNSTALFVLKKNKSVLEKLEQWLRLYNANSSNKIDIPMLLIDDEADNASVNTKKSDEPPSVINASIRKIIDLFTKSNYVGFTATPYANIFINPDSDKAMLNEDLFPRDFIYALEAPSNYIGARTVFISGGKHEYMLKNNDDCEYYISEKHKIDDPIPDELPKSLKEAIASFFIANAIRDLRGEKSSHRTMLINISRFIAVQKKISKCVDAYVRDMQREIKNYYLMGGNALRHKNIAFIKETYDKYFDSLKHSIKDTEEMFDWTTVQKALHAAVASIVVRTVNAGNAPKNLNYDECEEDGLRLIAVGGYSLSRGLTLEGLCISYFYRNSKMYDTLMQMGRWFGYRNHYADLCQIWMSDTSRNWYEYISEASDELRREVRIMMDLKQTPMYFGLSVRSDQASLLVTAVNKMRTAKDYDMTVGLSGAVIETPYLYMDKKTLETNTHLVHTWLEQLLINGYKFSEDKNLAVSNPQILNVPKKYITTFLDMYKSHPLNMSFRTTDIINVINTYDDDTVDNWDIAIATGSGHNDMLCNREIKYVQRRFAINKESKALQMSGERARLGSSNLAKCGLTKAEVKIIEDAAKAARSATDRDKAFSQNEYFNTGRSRRPLLVIYPVQLSAETKSKDGEDYNNEDKLKVIAKLGAPLIGLSIGFPSINGKARIVNHYKVNLVKWRELLGIDDDFEEIDDTSDEVQVN